MANPENDPIAAAIAARDKRKQIEALKKRIASRESPENRAKEMMDDRGFTMAGATLGTGLGAGTGAYTALRPHLESEALKNITRNADQQRRVITNLGGNRATFIPAAVDRRMLGRMVLGAALGGLGGGVLGNEADKAFNKEAAKITDPAIRGHYRGVKAATATASLAPALAMMHGLSGMGGILEGPALPIAVVDAVLAPLVYTGVKKNEINYAKETEALKRRYQKLTGGKVEMNDNLTSYQMAEAKLKNAKAKVEEKKPNPEANILRTALGAGVIGTGLLLAGRHWGHIDADRFLRRSAEIQGKEAEKLAANIRAAQAADAAAQAPKPKPGGPGFVSMPNAFDATKIHVNEDAAAHLGPTVRTERSVEEAERRAGRHTEAPPEKKPLPGPNALTIIEDVARASGGDTDTVLRAAKQLKRGSRFGALEYDDVESKQLNKAIEVLRSRTAGHPEILDEIISILGGRKLSDLIQSITFKEKHHIPDRIYDITLDNRTGKANMRKIMIPEEAREHFNAYIDRQGKQGATHGAVTGTLAGGGLGVIPGLLARNRVGTVAGGIAGAVGGGVGGHVIGGEAGATDAQSRVVKNIVRKAAIQEAFKKKKEPIPKELYMTELRAECKEIAKAQEAE